MARHIRRGRTGPARFLARSGKHSRGSVWRERSTAGKGGRLVYGAMRDRGQDIDFFVDEMSSDDTLCGKPVLRINEAPLASETEIYFTLSDDARSIRDPAITAVAELEAAGFARTLLWTDYMADYPPLFEFWQKGYAHIDYQALVADKSFNMERYTRSPVDPIGIAWLKDNLSDEISLDVLERILGLRQDICSGPILGLPDQLVHYFPRTFDVFRGIDRVRFADCGAYDGDTARSLLKNTPRPVAYIASFEPSPGSFVKLQETFGTLRRHHPETRFISYSCGVWSSNDFCDLADEDRESASLNPKLASGLSIPVVTLDSVLGSNPPNFIKFDVEGAETEALEGASTLIETYQPTLAISLYHRAADLWELPRLARALYPGYQLYLRHHHWSALETVLYCVAPDGPRRPVRN